jgi:predicted RNase H-like nuclease (RuvC/YqgF family)
LRELPVEDLTMEELLEAEEKISYSCGARAWEEFDNKPGITVKKLIQDTPHSDNVIPETIIESHSREESNGRKSKDERRIVTAIFSPARVFDPTPSKSKREEQLEDQVKLANLTLEEYKKRLEEVERKVSHMAEVELRLTRKIEKADQENKELQERIQEAEGKVAVTQPHHSSRSHPVLNQGVAARRKKVIENMDPQSISALSQYVLLVGMGVCAVVFRVVLKKVIGKGLKP